MGERGGDAHERRVIALLTGPPGGVEQHWQSLRVAVVMECGGETDGEVERHLGIGRVERTCGLQPTPVVGRCFVVGVGVFGQVSRLAGEFDCCAGITDGHRQAGVAGTFRQQPVVAGA